MNKIKEKIKNFFGIEFVVLSCCVLGIVLSICSGLYLESKDKSINPDGTFCKGGYKFTGKLSSSIQIFDSNGHGIPCKGKE